MSTLTALSCRDTGIEKKLMFELDIGRSESQIDLIQHEGVPFRNDIEIVLKEGLVYITDSVARKVMKFSSYGDLLMLVYNKSTNPEPVLLVTNKSSDVVANRTASTYEFNYVGNMAVGVDGTVFVEDRLPRERREFDEELEAQLQSVIRRFDPNGSYIGYIGQNGLSGAPFPYIRDIATNQRGDLIVVCRTSTHWITYWYDEQGNHRYTVKLAEDALPKPSKDSYASISRIVPATSNEELFVKADFYGNAQERGGDIGFLRSSVHSVDPRSGDIDVLFDLPRAYYNDDVSSRVKTPDTEISYELLGAAEDGYFFCIGPVSENTYQLLLLHREGRIVHRDLFVLDDAETLYRTFYVTPDGNLTGLFGGELSVGVHVWETRRYLEEDNDQNR